MMHRFGSCRGCDICMECWLKASTVEEVTSQSDQSASRMIVDQTGHQRPFGPVRNECVSPGQNDVGWNGIILSILKSDYTIQ